MSAIFFSNFVKNFPTTKNSFGAPKHLGTQSFPLAKIIFKHV